MDDITALAETAIGHPVFKRLIRTLAARFELDRHDVWFFLCEDLKMRLRRLYELLANPLNFVPTEYIKPGTPTEYRRLLRIFHLGINEQQHRDRTAEESRPLRVWGVFTIRPEIRVVAAFVFVSKTVPPTRDEDLIIPSPFVDGEGSDVARSLVRVAREEYILEIADKFDVQRYYLACPGCGLEHKTADGEPVELRRGGEVVNPVLTVFEPPPPDEEFTCKNERCGVKGRGVVQRKPRGKLFAAWWGWFLHLDRLLRVMHHHPGVATPLPFEATRLYGSLYDNVYEGDPVQGDRSASETSDFSAATFSLFIM